MTTRSAFFWGQLGAALPEMVRFFRIVSGGRTLPDLNWFLYLLLLTAYCMCAGFVSIAWKPEAQWKAIWVGASLPALVGALVQSVPANPH